MLLKPPFSRNRCKVCRTQLTVHQDARGGLCDSPTCRRQNVVNSVLQRQREETATVTQAALALRQRMAQMAGLDDGGRLKLAIVPHYRQPLRTLASTHRRALRTHLESIIRQAYREKIDGNSLAALHLELEAAVDATPERPVVSSTCATCQGHCCRAGGTKAYLDVAVIRSFLALNPGVRPSVVLRAYMDRLPGKTYDGSCVYHGRTGCGLPRSMRSAICNRFFCAGLKALRSELAGVATSDPVLVVTVEGPELQHAALLRPTESGVQIDPMDSQMANG